VQRAKNETIHPEMHPMHEQSSAMHAAHEDIKSQPLRPEFVDWQFHEPRRACRAEIGGCVFWVEQRWPGEFEVTVEIGRFECRARASTPSEARALAETLGGAITPDVVAALDAIARRSVQESRSHDAEHDAPELSEQVAETFNRVARRSGIEPTRWKSKPPPVRFYLHGDVAEHDGQLCYSSIAKRFVPRDAIGSDADLRRLYHQLRSRLDRRLPPQHYRPVGAPNVLEPKLAEWTRTTTSGR
jgi:hypothetical protein